MAEEHYQHGVSYQLPDDRLRAVEVGLSVLVEKVETMRNDVKVGFSLMNLEGRLKTCPHNEDFVRVLAALESGGKRFAEIEHDLEVAIDNRCKTTTDHEDRISALEDEWKSAVTSVKTAKWVVGFFGLMVGWIFNEMVPIIEKVFGIYK